VRLLPYLDLGALRQQHPDGNLQSPPGWVHDTDRPIFALRSAKDLQGSTMQRMKGVEDPNMIRAQGIVGVGAKTLITTPSPGSLIHRYPFWTGTSRISCRSIRGPRRSSFPLGPFGVRRAILLDGMAVSFCDNQAA
jgi:hypothetical protein